MKRLKKFFTPAIIFFFLALAVRLGFLIYYFKLSGNFQSTLYTPTTYHRDYDSIAVSILKGYGFRGLDMFQSFRHSFYPIFLAFLYSLLGHSYRSYLAVFLVQAFLSSLSVVLIFLIGKKIFNSLVGLIAALIACFYLPFIRIINELELEALLIFMPLLFVFCLLKIEDKKDLGIKIITGLTMGLTIFTKGVFLFILPVFTFLWLRLVIIGKHFWKTIFIIFISAFLTLLPWLTRNFLIHKKILFSSVQGFALHLIVNSKFETYDMQEYRELIWEFPQLSEAGKNSYYTNTAIDNLKRNPNLYLKRVLNNWPLLFEISIFPSFVHLLSLLAIIGLIFSLIKKNFGSILLFLLFLLFCTQYALIVAGVPSYRMPFDWILMLFAGYGLIESVKRAQKAIIPKNRLSAKIKQWELLINKKEVPKKITTKLKIAGMTVFLGLIGVSLVQIVPRYFLEEIISYPKINNRLVEEPFAKHNLLEQWQLQENKQLEYTEVFDYQKSHNGDITPYVGSLVVWQGEVNYINHNSFHPLGSTKDSDENLDPKYRGFYDIYSEPSTIYSTFSLTINRGIKPQYYGDGVVIVNYKGSLLNKLKNGDKIAVIGKIIGQNYYYGQIYLEGYDVYK